MVLHLVSGRIVIEAELDSSRVAARLRHVFKGLYKIDSSMVVIHGTGIRKLNAMLYVSLKILIN